MEHSWLFDRHGLQRTSLELCLGFRWLQYPAEVGWLVLFAILAPASLVNSVQVHEGLHRESKTSLFAVNSYAEVLPQGFGEQGG